MNYLTDFADQAVILPLVTATLIALLALRWWRGALGWTCAVVFTLGTILVLKVVCTACAAHFAATGLHSPSGHTASACLVYGGLFVLIARRPSQLLPALLCGALFAAVFGYSRLALHVHTPADVAVGALVGLTGVAVLVGVAGARPTVLQRWPLAVAILAAATVFHGVHFPAEEAIRRFALEDWLPLASACRV